MIYKKISDLVIHYSNIKYAKKRFLHLDMIKFQFQEKFWITTKQLIWLMQLWMVILHAGRFNLEFEKKLSEFLNIRSLTTVNSGSG